MGIAKRYIVDLRSFSPEEREKLIENLALFETTSHIVEPFVFSVVWEEPKSIAEVLRIPPDFVHPETG